MTIKPHFLFPPSPLNLRMIDEAFQDQAIALKQAGFGTSIVDIDAGRISPSVLPENHCVYRGWMLNSEEYQHYLATVITNRATPFTPLDQYVMAHHLPNWYPLVSRFTPKTEVFPTDGGNIVESISALGWAKFQLKDYVKSLKTGDGSVITERKQIAPALENMVKYRGTIEGGIVVRSYEEFFAGSEKRYFVINGRYYGQQSAFDIRAMRILEEVKGLIPSPFWSIDIAMRVEDGEFRVVEIGDGQVSDLVGWTEQRFAQVWQQATL